MSEIVRIPRTDRARLTAAVAAGVDHLWRTQRSDGSWEALNEVGPISTAQMLVTLHYLGRLDPADAADAARWLRGQQRPDGSFDAHVDADCGDLGTTATAWAALHIVGDSAAEAARAYVERHGGTDAVVAAVASGEPAAYNLAIAGLLDPQRLPRLPLSYCLVEPLRAVLNSRFNGAVQTVLLEFAALGRRLRGEWGADGLAKSDVDERSCRHLLGLLDEFQNRDGSWWNAVTPWSGLILATLHAMALPESADRIERGLKPLEQRTVRDADGLHWGGFGDGVWATGFNVGALLSAGVPADDARLGRAAEWLLGSQIERPASPLNNRRAGVARSGLWSYQRDNDTLVDADDTAVAAGALLLAAPGAPAAERLNAAALRGLDCLAGMQNADGGWPAYSPDMPLRPAGPLYQSVPDIDLGDANGLAAAFAESPAELGDPSTEDLTSRVLHAYGAAGRTLVDPAVAKAIEFLRDTQRADGCWWGRWTGNYATSTAWALIGLRAVGVDADEPWLRRAVEWLLSRQNADGGWGESHRSYRDPELAGHAASMPQVTGLIVVALCDVGLRHHPAVARAERFLIERQRPDGTWDRCGFLHALIPPNTFYTLPSADHFWPLEALGRLLHDAPSQPTIAAPEAQREDFRDAMRRQGDPIADAAAANLGCEARDWPALVASLGRPGGALPPPVAEYFAATAALPAWADAEQIRRGQALFARHGWEISLALFYSALPQGYAIGPCARTMRQTRSLTEAARRRIFETAQFLFDVLDEGGLAPGGRGVRACQTIRLLHAVLRRRLAGAVPEADGVPINQEDELGTLLLFSVSTLDVLRKVGVTVGAADAEAWVHTWAVVGHLLGIDERLLPRSVAEAEVGLMAVRRRHWEATAEGKALGAALVDLLAEYYPPQLAQVPLAMVRYFAGPRCAELLGLPTVDWERLALDGSGWAFGLCASGDLTTRFNSLVGQFVQKALGGVMMMQAQGQFDWAKLMLEASKAAGLIPAGDTSPLRALAFWLMKAIVQAERNVRLPAALAAGSAA